MKEFRLLVILLLIGLCLLATQPLTSDDNYQIHYTVRFSLSDLRFDEIMGYDFVRLQQHGWLTQPGKPMLPLKELRIALPRGMSAARVYAVDVKTDQISGEFKIFPAQAPRKITSTDENFNNILFDSDIVELVYSKMNINKDDQGSILSVDVQYRFRNIADRNIEINVFVEFYDIEDNFLTREGPKEISIPKGWTEQGISPANIIKYSGEKSSLIEYLKIIVEERF